MSRLAEHAMQVLTDFCIANLNTEISAVSATYTDSIPLPTIATPNFYYGPRHNLPEFPACIVWHPDVPTILEPHEFGNTFAIMKHDLVVEVAVQTDLESNINHGLLRYGEAIFNMLYKNQTLGGGNNILSVMPNEMARAKVENHKRQVLLQSVAWRCAVRMTEEYV